MVDGPRAVEDVAHREELFEDRIACPGACTGGQPDRDPAHGGEPDPVLGGEVCLRDRPRRTALDDERPSHGVTQPVPVIDERVEHDDDLARLFGMEAIDDQRTGSRCCRPVEVAQPVAGLVVLELGEVGAGSDAAPRKVESDDGVRACRFEDLVESWRSGQHRQHGATIDRALPVRDAPRVAHPHRQGADDETPPACRTKCKLLVDGAKARCRDRHGGRLAAVALIRLVGLTGGLDEEVGQRRDRRLHGARREPGTLT